MGLELFYKDLCRWIRNTSPSHTVGLEQIREIKNKEKRIEVAIPHGGLRTRKVEVVPDFYILSPSHTVGLEP